MIHRAFGLAAGLLAAVFVADAASAATLDSVRERGFINCGVGENFPGFFAPDSAGKWSGLDIDFCRALSAAVFNDPDKVKYLPATPAARFAQLQSGQVDILSRSVTWNLSRDAGLGLSFAGVTFFDGQGFMVRKALGAKSAKDLDGAAVCTQTGTTTELNLADYFRANKMKFSPVVIERLEENIAAYQAGRCDVYTTDASGLASVRSNLAAPNDHVILPERISKEPLGPMVRKGDDQWFGIVKWTLTAMIEAEEYGVTQANVDEMLKSSNPGIQRMLGVTPGFGKALGLDEKWAYNVIKQVGNYADSYERNVGPKTPIGLERGVNDLWTKGGLMYALPLR